MYPFPSNKFYWGGTLGRSFLAFPVAFKRNSKYRNFFLNNCKNTIFSKIIRSESFY